MPLRLPVDKHSPAAVSRSVVVEDDIDEGNLDQGVRVVASAVELERPAKTRGPSRKLVCTPDWIDIHRRNLVRDAQMPEHDAGVRAVHRAPRL